MHVTIIKVLVLAVQAAEEVVVVVVVVDSVDTGSGPSDFYNGGMAA